MRAFQVGDVFQGDHSGLKAEVIWVDPHDHFRAVVNVMKGSEIEKLEQTVFAIQFLNYWTLIKEGPPSS
jgi:hypothetical protein